MVVERVAQVLVLGQEIVTKWKGKEDLHASGAKSVEHSSTKGRNFLKRSLRKINKGPQPQQQDDSGGSGRDKGDEESVRYKGKGKQVLQSSDKDY